MRYLSLCSGIEGASVAWEPLGWKPVAFAEIEAFPSAVLKAHYPSVPNLGDITQFREWPDLGTVDLVCGGTPCQSFSVAGLRAGLADPRGDLMLTYLAIVGGLRPRWVVWENVPGVLSSNGGRDFGTFLSGLGQLGYGWAYRVLDAQYVRVDGFPRAVPQRRRRVWVVGCLGDWAGAAAVLSERQSLLGDTPPRRQARQGSAPTIGGCSNGGGGHQYRQHGNEDGLIATALPGVSGTVSSKWFKGSGGPAGDEAYNLVAHTLRDAGFDASEDGTGRGIPLISHALGAQHAHVSEDGTGRGVPLVPIDMRQASRGEKLTNNRAQGSGGAPGHGIGETGDPAFTVSERGQAIAFDTTQITSVANYSQPKPGDPCHPLASGAHPLAIAFDITGTGPGMLNGARETDIHTALRACKPPGMSEASTTTVLAEAVAFDSHNNAKQTVGTLAADGSGGRNDINHPVVFSGWQVRRLTPVECERLQGFPDNYTLVAYRGKPAADGPRYRALGNAWAVNCARWVGRRIEMVKRLASEDAA
jgi:DNA (cytosine-5)-methyltransferase 1